MEESDAEFDFLDDYVDHEDLADDDIYGGEADAAGDAEEDETDDAGPDGAPVSAPESAETFASDFNEDIVVVAPDDRITTSRLSLYNVAEIISIRTDQIARFNNCLVDITGLSNAEDMAKKELMERKCPLVLRRHVGSGMRDGKLCKFYEYWDPNEMEFPVVFD